MTLHGELPSWTDPELLRRLGVTGTVLDAYPHESQLVVRQPGYVRRRLPLARARTVREQMRGPAILERIAA